MTADHGSEQGRQRTVAELLQQYGGGTGSTGRRRRRGGRAELEDTSPTSPPPAPPARAEPAAEETWSSFSTLAREDQRGAAGSEPDSPWTDSGAPGLSSYGPSGYRSGMDSGRDGSGVAAPGLDPPGGSGWTPPESSQRVRPGDARWARPASTEWTHSGSNDWSSRFESDDWTRSGGEPAESEGFGPGNRAGADQRGYGGDAYRAEAHAESASGSEPGSAFGSPGRSTLSRWPSSAAPEQPTEQMPRYGGAGLGASGLTQRPGASTGPITARIPRTASPSADGGDTSSSGAGAMTAGAPRADAARAVEDSGPSTAISSRAELFADDQDPEDESLGAPGRVSTAGRASGGAGPHPGTSPTATAAPNPAGAAPADVPAGLAGGEGTAGDAVADTDDAEPQSGLKAWAILIGQGIAGAVGGALLWVGFRFLWLNLPVVALAAAVIATAGLVLVVRTIRGSDDLQTTMLAVLVGLIVTISPAVLLLALH
jgi:hypothetical protein